MKELEITDKHGSGKTLMCERHYRKYLPQISLAAKNKVAVIVKNTKTRGCVQCLHEKLGTSPWCGVMFKIWRGNKSRKNEGEKK